jgi:hypothetical protein
LALGGEFSDEVAAVVEALPVGSGFGRKRRVLVDG